MKADKALVLFGIGGALGLAIYFIYKVNKVQERVNQSVDDFANDAKQVYEVASAPQVFVEEKVMSLSERIGYGTALAVNYPYAAKTKSILSNLFGSDN